MFTQYICIVLELPRFQSSFQISVNLHPPTERPPQVNTESTRWYEKDSHIVHIHFYRCALVLHRGCTLESLVGLKKKKSLQGPNWRDPSNLLALWKVQGIFSKLPRVFSCATRIKNFWSKLILKPFHVNGMIFFLNYFASQSSTEGVWGCLG